MVPGGRAAQQRQACREGSAEHNGGDAEAGDGRQQAGADDADERKGVYRLHATLALTGAIQRLKLLDPVVLAYLAGLSALVLGSAWWFAHLPAAQMQAQSSLLSNAVLLGMIGALLLAALYKRVNVYDSFIEGAKEGFQVAVGIIPYLIAMLAAIALLRASGALDLLIGGLKQLVADRKSVV